MILNFLNLFIILGILVGTAYLLKRFVKGKKYGSMNYSEHISVIDEGITLGLGQKVSIIKAGEELFLLIYGQNGTECRPLNNSILLKEQKWENQLGNNEHSSSLKELGELIKK